MVTITLTPEHAYPLIVVIGYFLVGQVLGGLVNAARNRFKIPLPNLYANAAMFLKDGKVDETELKSRGDAFNRTQRGHQHMFEIHADAYALLFCSSLLYPVHAAYAGIAYVTGTLLYGIGYSKANNYRLLGEAFYFPGIFYMVYLTAHTAYTLLH